MPTLKEIKQVLEFERNWWVRFGDKNAAIKEIFGLSEAEYLVLLGAVLDSGQISGYEQFFIRRLRRWHSDRLHAALDNQS